MSLRRRMPAAALTVLVAVALAGCTTQHPAPTPAKTTAHSPLFATDAEALDAATKAYAAYLKVSDEISHDGGKNPERIKPYVTSTYYKKQVGDFELLAQKKIVADGVSSFDTVSVKQIAATKSGANIDLYLCLDVSRIRLRSENSDDVTPSNRPGRLPLEVGIRATSSDLLVSRSEVWSGNSYC